MSKIFLSLEVSIFLFVEIFVLFMLFIALYHTFVILLKYNTDVGDSLQYALEKKSYLVGVIVWVAFIVKIFLLLFFVYTLSQLTDIVPGAMCGAGVIGSNMYGEPLLLLKIAIVFLACFWILLNTQEQRDIKRTFFRVKLWFFLALFFLIALEATVGYLFFSHISTQNPVLCCSAIYKGTEFGTSLPFEISNVVLVVSFYSLLVLTLVSNYKKYRALNILLTLLFAYVSYYAIVYFFGTYIYELPTHRCPFCLFQSEYNYIGYFIFGSLFIASFYSISSSLYIYTTKSHIKAMLWYLIFTCFVSYSFILYIFHNRVFL